MPCLLHVYLNTRGCRFFSNRDETFTEHHVMRCDWTAPDLKGGGRQALGTAYGRSGIIFWGVLPCHRDVHLVSCVDGGCCPLCRVAFAFCCGLGLPAVPVLLRTGCPSQDRAWLMCSALEGSYWKRKPCFSGGRTTIESFKRLNNSACSRSVSLTAKYCGENNTLNLSWL